MRLAIRPILAALAMLVFVLGAPRAEAEIVLHDLKGRTVTLAAPAKRLVVDDGRMIVALSFLSRDPVGLIAAWPHDVDRFGRELYASYRKRFPQIDSLPRTASNAQDMNVEEILAARPDAVLLSVYSHRADQQLRELEQAKIPVIFVDFVTDPLNNTDRSLEIVGKAIGREAQAERVVALRTQHRTAIANRIAGLKDAARPSVFMETHASTRETCCNSPGSEGIGKFLQFVGARNIGDILGNKPFGKLNMEYVVSAKPDVYIASGGIHEESRRPADRAAFRRRRYRQVHERPSGAARPGAPARRAEGSRPRDFAAVVQFPGRYSGAGAAGQMDASRPVQGSGC